MFHLYGGRGITVCDRWRNDFATFLADIGPRPSMKHSIDRINSDGNYEPANCRWILLSEQSGNTRRNHRIVVNGTSMTLAEISRATGIKAATIQKRLTTYGLSIDDAIRPGDRRGHWRTRRSASTA